jgi:RNA polymerase sigma-70 factor (ECF subfamily)
LDRKRQNETFLAWVKAHQTILRKVARSFGPPGEWNDLYQDLLIAVWEAVPAYRSESKLSTFIYRVACNRALNWSREFRRQRDRFQTLDTIPAPVAPLVENDELLLDQLYAAIATLPPIDRSLALLYLDELSYREIADVLGISETNVGVRLNRVRKALAAQFEEVAG